MIHGKIGLSDEQWIRNYDWNGNNPSRWIDSANSLCICYNILWKKYKKSLEKIKKGGIIPIEMEVLSPALLLLGYTIECFLKAIWVKNKNILAKNGKFINSLKCKSHDLVKIAKVVGVEFDKTEEDILERLSEAILSKGRYPISKSCGKKEAFFWSMEDSIKIKKLIDRFYNQLNGL